MMIMICIILDPPMGLHYCIVFVLYFSLIFTVYICYFFQFLGVWKQYRSTAVDADLKGWIFTAVNIDLTLFYITVIVNQIDSYEIYYKIHTDEINQYAFRQYDCQILIIR